MNEKEVDGEGRKKVTQQLCEICFSQMLKLIMRGWGSRRASINTQIIPSLTEQNMVTNSSCKVILIHFFNRKMC